MSLVRLLPNTKHTKIHDSLPQVQESKVVQVSGVPKLGQRQRWVPRTLQDFEDGGAFPEIHVAQYPMGLGLEKSKSNALAPSLDAEGRIKFDAIVRQGHSADRVIFSRLDDMRSRTFDENDPSLQKPSEEDVAKIQNETKTAFENILSTKMDASAFVPPKLAAPVIYRHTPSEQGMAFNSGAQQRLIRVFEAPKDPMAPSRFRINKKIPRGPPSPPVPVLHSPDHKPSMEELSQWKIPPCISNWKNNRGFTVPLDKRLAADGRGLQSLHINEKFAKFAEALYIADRKAREEVEKRNQYHERVAQKAREREEERLRVAAHKARDENVFVKPTVGDDAFMEREEYRVQKQHDRQRERNQARADPNKKSKLIREQDRDITEKIAIGVPNPNKRMNDMSQFDARLFNQPQGIDTGFNEGDDEGYSVYDKPWRSDVAAQIYRPSKSIIDRENYGDELQREIQTNRFVPDRGFKGVDKDSRVDGGPVQFEKDEDPFGLTKFLSDAKTGGRKRPNDDAGGSGSKRR